MASTSAQTEVTQHIILFYKYHPLSSAKETTEIYRQSLEKLCQALSLKGRILVGYSKSEGINGTLAGKFQNVKAFTVALLGESQLVNDESENHELGGEERRAILEFWKESREFFILIEEPVLKMNSPDDFKWSRSVTNDNLFPDLNIKLVKELIGTGGVLSSIPLEETAKGYLTPRQWHEALTSNKTSGEDTILIDCRNKKEFDVGHFEGSVDPDTANFSQFPKWVDDHKHMLANKRVFMYCTGGIRCEKASAYVRRQVPSATSVQHLKGGIHKYLEEVGDNNDESLWQGRNFVFHADVQTKLGCDGGDSADVNTNPKSPGNIRSCDDIVGKCIYCQEHYDQFDPHCVCTVCREPTLCCRSCQQTLSEFHCKQHFHLRMCYFTDLSPFSVKQLTQQIDDLESILITMAVGKRYKQKRKTLHKQCSKIRQHLSYLQEEHHEETQKDNLALRCRNCNDPGCSGRCWGFYSLKRKEFLEQKHQARREAIKPGMCQENPQPHQEKKRGMKECNRDRISKEMEQLHMSMLPSAHRGASTGIRVPPPCTRKLQTKMKGKWKGMPVIQVVRDEFVELAKPGVLDRILELGLLRVNEAQVTFQTAGAGLMTGDSICRIAHWHEPPVIVPETIAVEKVRLPGSVLDAFNISKDSTDVHLFVCNKPSSVPVHPAGPYLANSMTMMVEAQENIPPQSLFPCHRTDRVTSGLTICCTNTDIARIVQRTMCAKQVQKLYLAQVHGKFPSSNSELNAALNLADSMKNLVSFSFLSERKYVRVDAPIETVDPANGIRKITEQGKPSQSLFQILSYDPDRDTSILMCRPITGRSHQLRVHLQLLGFPIVNDVQYGGFMLTKDFTFLKSAAIDALVNSTKQPQLELKSVLIPEKDACAARDACPLCRSLKENPAEEAAQSFYTPAQLLDCGYSIDLHAFRYRINFLGKDTKSNGRVEDPIGSLDLSVEYPSWLDPAQIEQIGWLEE